MPVRPNHHALEVRAQLAQKAAHHLNLKEQAREVEVDVKASTTAIKDLFAQAAPEANGKHQDLHLVLPDGVTKVLVQMQGKESVSLRPNHLAVLRQKLGKDAEMFIVKQEVLTPNALDQLVTMGKLTPADLHDLTETTASKSLVVKTEK